MILKLKTSKFVMIFSRILKRNKIHPLIGAFIILERIS